jgi:hypothetical protein
MRAVRFALAGSDDYQPIAIDRGKCVFRLGKDTFYLNNVHVDRLKIQGWKRTSFRSGTSYYVTVSLHSDDVVYEHTTRPEVDDGSARTAEIKRAFPEAFTIQQEKHREKELRLDTADQDRVTRA